MMNRNALAGSAVQGPGFPKKQVLSGKNVPGAERPSCEPSIPVAVIGWFGLPTFGRALGCVVPAISKPSNGVSGEPLSNVAIPDHCQRSVNALRSQFCLE